MRHITFTAVALCATLFCAFGANSAEPSSEEQTLNCDVGPLNKTYGKTRWLVYSCSDDRTLVFVSAPGSPAMPFYFRLYNGQLTGEGTGDKLATDAAYEEIKALSTSDVKELVRQTKAPKP